MVQDCQVVHYRGIGSESDEGCILRREARLMMLLPLLPLAAAKWTTCTGGPPIFLYPLYLLTVVRSKWVEYGMLQRLGVRFSFGRLFEFAVGIFEQMDWLILRMELFRKLWAAAFRQWGWPLTPIVGTLRLCGACRSWPSPRPAWRSRRLPAGL